MTPSNTAVIRKAYADFAKGDIPAVSGYSTRR